MKKIKHITLAFLLSISMISKVFATENEAVKDAEVVLSTFNDDGILEPIGAPVQTNADGSFEIELPASFPEHKPVFAVVQDPTGVGAQQISYIDPDSKDEDDLSIDPKDTAVAKTLMSFMAETDDIDPASVPKDMIKEFHKEMSEAIKDVPLPESTADAMTRYSDALSLKPDAFLNAVSKAKFNVDPTDTIRVAALVGDAAGADFDPLSERPNIPDDIPSGSPTPGLIPAKFLKKHAAKDFNFAETFGEDILPPGGLVGEIPKGAFMMPAGVRLDEKTDFGDAPVFPQGVEVPKGFKMPPNAVVPPGVILEDGFEPPPGFKLPKGVIASPDFNPENFGAEYSEEFVPPEDFVPPPGFALTDSKGGFGFPDGFHLPKGFELPPEAKKFPPPPGFLPPRPPKGFDDLSHKNFEEFPADFEFPPEAKMPSNFRPESFGEGFNFQPPAGFVPKEFTAKGDFEKFKGDDFIAFDPNGGFDPEDKFGGFRGPPIDPSTGEPVKGFFDPRKEHEGIQFPNSADGEFDPFATFKEPPKHPPLGEDGQPIHDGNLDGEAPKDGQPPAGEEPKDGEAPKDGQPPAGEEPKDGEAPKDGQAPAGEEPKPAGEEPVHQEPPPENTAGASQPAGEVAPPPPPPPPPPQEPAGEALLAKFKKPKAKRVDARKRLKARGKFLRRSARTVVSLGSGEVSDVLISAPDGTNANSKKARLTASEGVYLVGKTNSNSSTITVPVIVDPSTTKSTVKVTLNVDNKVESTDLAVESSAVQLVTTLEGNYIQATTGDTGIEISSGDTVSGYLLPPGSSASGLLKAQRVVGTVTAGDSSTLIKFKKPKKTQSGIYTVVFFDGDEQYFGKVTLGSLKAKTVSGKVLAPGGKL